MYAIIEVGAKQFNVKKDDIIEVERLEAEEGKDIVLEHVLLVAKGAHIEVGSPFVKEAKVLAQVLKHMRGEKKVSFKYRRRKASHWTKGHRQELVRLKIKEIKAG
jgi:large subunit ribosomal protein L21